MLRLCFAVALTLVALPAAAADRTETLSFTYLRAADLEQWLTVERPPASGKAFLDPEIRPADAQPRKLSEVIRKPYGITVPEGLTAWAADDRKNVLTVSGSPEALRQLKQIARLLDVPVRRIRISVRLVQLEAAAAEEYRKGPEVATDGGLTSLTPTAEVQRAILNRPALLETAMTVNNNRPMHLVSPKEPGKPVEKESLVPRVNGDNTVTLIADGWFRNNKGGTETGLLRRLASGTAVLVLDSANRAWLITPEVLVD